MLHPVGFRAAFAPVALERSQRGTRRGIDLALVDLPGTVVLDELRRVRPGPLAG